MEYTYKNLGGESIPADENLPRPKYPIIRVTDKNGSFSEKQMVYTDNALDFDKSQRSVLADYEMAIGQGKTHMDYTFANLGKVWRDDVYMAGELARQDISISTDEGSSIVDKLEAGWDGFVPDYRTRNINLVSEFTPLRAPYVNNSISFYEQNSPSEELITQYGLPYETYLPWYGLKFDKVTNSVAMKAVLPFVEMHRVHSDIATKIEKLIPVCGNHFFAVIYNTEKKINSNIDVYFYASHDTVSNWINTKNPDMALPYTDTSLNDKLWIWGAVYNTELNKLTHLKAYIRYYLED